MERRNRRSRCMGYCSSTLPGPYPVPRRYHRLMISTAYLRVYVEADGADRDATSRESSGRGAPIQSDGRFIWNEPLREDVFSATWNGIGYTVPSQCPAADDRRCSGVLGDVSADPAHR